MEGNFWMGRVSSPMPVLHVLFSFTSALCSTTFPRAPPFLADTGLPSGDWWQAWGETWRKGGRLDGRCCWSRSVSRTEQGSSFLQLLLPRAPEKAARKRRWAEALQVRGRPSNTHVLGPRAQLLLEANSVYSASSASGRAMGEKRTACLISVLTGLPLTQREKAGREHHGVIQPDLQSRLLPGQQKEEIEIKIVLHEYRENVF